MKNKWILIFDPTMIHINSSFKYYSGNRNKNMGGWLGEFINGKSRYKFEYHPDNDTLLLEYKK